MARPPHTRLAYSTGQDVARRPEKAPSAVAPDTSKGIRLRLDRRTSGRVVTTVSGLPGTPDQLAALCKELKSACGSGGTFKDGVLELQGDHRDRVEEALAARGLRSKRAGG